MISEYIGEEKKNSLLYFYASWSSECNLHLEALNKLSLENPELDIVKVNVTRYQSVKLKYNVKRIPTYILLKNGNVIGRIDGFIDQYSLKRWLNGLRS